MRQTIVPSQIINVEDRITANISLSQAALLVGAVLSSIVVFYLIAPVFKVSSMKIIFASVVSIFFIALSLRFKGQIILSWLILFLRYSLRPRIYVFNKNYLLAEKADRVSILVDKKTSVILFKPLLPTTLRSYEKLAKVHNFSFSGKGGKIRVAFQEKS